MTTTEKAPGLTPEEIAAILGRAERRSVSQANDDVFALLDEVDRLRALVSEQAAALARVEALADEMRGDPTEWIGDDVLRLIRTALAGEQ